MKLSKFIQNNNINKSKYIIKGFCYGSDEQPEKTTELFILMYNLTAKEKKKEILNIRFDSTMQNIYYNLISNNAYKIPKTKIKLTHFKRCLGYLETTFKITTDELKTTYLDSNFLKIVESKDKKVSINILDKDRFFDVDFNHFIKNLNSNIWVPDKMIVHDGKMHADDILSVALVKYCNPDVQIMRTRNIPDNFSGLVADVGNGRYDHHELDKPRINAETEEQYINENGKLEYYAAFGLLAKDLLPGIIDYKGYYTIDHQYIRSLDDADNNGTFNDFASMLELFNPNWNSDETEDENFLKAVSIAEIFIKRLINKEKAKAQAFPYVLSKIKEIENNILILDKRAPWQGLAKNSSALLCLYPVNDGYAIQCVRSKDSSARDDSLKITLPDEWLINQPTGLIFCHKSLFFATFDTKEHALIAANEVVSNYNQK